MNIIGISGLNNSVDFKQRNFPDLTSQQLRIVQGLDSAAALINDEKIVAAVAEERFTRIKGTGDFPIHAIEYCLRAGRLKAKDIDYIAHSYSYEPLQAIYQHSRLSQQLYNEVLSPEAQQRCLEQFCAKYDWQDKLVSVPHHIAHAASAFYPSGFDEALVLVTDGMGEQDSATIAVASQQGLEVIARIPALHSLGIFYGLFTLYLGFEFNSDEYKVMGLAPYGNARRYFSQIMDLVSLKGDGSYSISILHANQSEYDRETYSSSLLLLEQMFGPVRTNNESLEQHHRDIAAALQMVLQTCLLHTLRYYQKQTGLKHLCMAGGVALNCSANGIIHRSLLFNDLFIQPAAGDDGTALGAALWVKHQQNKGAKTLPMSLPLWGPEYDKSSVSSALKKYPELCWDYHESTESLFEVVAQDIQQSKIIGWFQGRAEFGPRALGNRSILADPRAADMRERINALIKQREDFRPFAPAVMEEYTTEYFDIDPQAISIYKSMLLIAQVKREWRSKLAAVTHVDGSARVQTVAKKDNPRFWALLKQCNQDNGLPVLLNTSFNVRGQPIVCSPSEAIDTFIAAGLDVLVLGNYRITLPQEKKL